MHPQIPPTNHFTQGVFVKAIERLGNQANRELAPIAVFAYKRPEHLSKTLAALAHNVEAARSHLTIFCDGAKSEQDQALVQETRAVAGSAIGFASITMVVRPVNLGLAESITTGVTAMLQKSERVIVFEDDLITSRYCLDYVNRALDRYVNAPQVASIGCYVFPVATSLPESFFLRVTDCFGWATWRDRWQSYEPDVRMLVAEIERRGMAQQFDLGGAYPYMRMLRDCQDRKNSSWAVRWYASQFLLGRLCVYPGKSMTMNIGMDGSGVHSGDTRVYDIALADCPLGKFPDGIEEDRAAFAATAAFLRGVVADNGRWPVRIRRKLAGMYKQWFASA